MSLQEEMIHSVNKDLFYKHGLNVCASKCCIDSKQFENYINGRSYIPPDVRESIRRLANQLREQSGIPLDNRPDLQAEYIDGGVRFV